MMLYLLSLLIGIVAGLRAMTAPAAVSWAIDAGLLDISGSWLAFMGYRFTPWLFSLLAVAELVTDKLPGTPSRKTPPQFGARLLSGGLSGATIGAAGGMLVGGAILGVAGAVIGTLGGAGGRARLVASFGKDRPAALVEDIVAVFGAALIVLSLA
ncbi:DUF4126 domain-containing protein [Cupriavidus basilensis]|uniref:DUF4126 domain-containing protein n=1 Tax=Cupriavidus basilensis TaxID=68895 RepID=A0ABT6AV89_9BURK|nr:DUF4126 domain-containing protein [Cupriavidus basilensis]MDF3836535.1 DUF4126 domain-containing protein [Cupriavidus basilensis]